MNRYKLLSLLLTAVGLVVTPWFGANLNKINATNINATLASTEIAENPLADYDMAKAQRWTDIAKLLAGINVSDDSAFAEIQTTQAWLNHKSYFDNSWPQLESQQLSKVREWANTELATINEKKPVVFYPFSGPDFLYAYSFFPQGQEYILVGLEPIGVVPHFDELSIAQTDQKLQEARGSLQAILQWSFFRTNDMKVDMAQQGVLPILMLFMARTNNQILHIEYVGINSEAQLEKLEEGMVPGVKIVFLPEGESQPRTLYYFSTDLSDGGLASNPQFPEFIKQLDQPATYLKAASYLMHYSYFSNIRNLILSESSSVLQDDSGMPVKYFDRNKWDLQFYGTYTQPIPLFKEEHQPDLRQIYQTDNDIKPLDFGVGYKYGVNESNLMLAIPK